MLLLLLFIYLLNTKSSNVKRLMCNKRQEINWKRPSALFLLIFIIENKCVFKCEY